MPGVDRIDCVEMGLAPLYVALRQNGHLDIQHMQIVRVKAQNSEQIRLTFKGIRTSFGDPSFSSSCCVSSLVTLTTLSLLLSKVTSWTSSVLYKTINITLLLTPMSVCVRATCVSLCVCVHLAGSQLVQRYMINVLSTSQLSPIGENQQPIRRQNICLFVQKNFQNAQRLHNTSEVLQNSKSLLQASLSQQLLWMT